MSQTLTNRVEAIINTPGTGEAAQVSELNTNFTKLDNHFIPGAELRRTTVQSIPNNTTTEIDFTTVGYDSYASRSEGAMASIASNGITIRKTGFYLVSLVGSFAANATGIRRIQVVKNTVAMVSNQKAGSSAASMTVEVTKPMLLDEDDLIEGAVFQNSGAALDLSNNAFDENLALSVIWMGAGVEV
jgi:hypothetical protein